MNFLKTIAAAAAIFLFPGIIFACSLTPDADRMKEPVENVGYTYIFYGTVTAKNGEQYSPEGSVYTFDVERDLKGNVQESIRISSPGHSCGSFFEVGQKGIFFLNDLESIDETNPQYFFGSEQEALDVYAQLEVLVSDQRPQACTKEYRPVCAERIVQCVTTPCPAVEETFANQCLAESEGLTVKYEGACRADQSEQQGTPTIPEQIDTFEEPSAGPPSDFQEPTSPPPSNSKPEIEVKPTIWEKIKDFFRGLLFWK